MPPRRPVGPLRAIDLFSGAGGLTQGFRDAGYDVTFALDKNRDSTDTYRRNHPDTRVETASITDFTPAEILEMAGGHVDVVVGGPSCQGFSTAGRSNGWVRADDERNQLWEHMLAVVAHLRPRAFLMENVPGLVYWKSGEFGERILKGFRDLGYTVDHGILLAADYGVPQRRRRLFMVGLLGETPYRFPDPTHLGGWRRDHLTSVEEERKRRGLRRHVSCWEAIGDLPRLGPGPGGQSVKLGVGEASPYARSLARGAHTVSDHEVVPLSTAHLELVGHVPQGGTWRDVPPHLLPDRFRGMRRTDSTNLLGRLDPDLPSYTITTQFTNITVGCNIHPFDSRSLSIREGARLQSFPDTYEFEGSFASRARQIGNAVPPLLAQALAAEIAAQVSPQKARRYHKAPVLTDPGSEGNTEHTPAKLRRRAGTKGENVPDAAIFTRLARQGLKPRRAKVALPGLTRNPSFSIPEMKLAVFVDGCFMHGCPEHSRATRSSTFWWAENIKARQVEDRAATETLVQAGWTVVQVWEHEDPEQACARISGLVDTMNSNNSHEPETSAG